MSGESKIVGLNNNSAKIQVSFPDGDINRPSFRVEGLAFDGGGSQEGMYICVLEACAKLFVDEAEKIRTSTHNINHATYWSAPAND